MEAIKNNKECLICKETKEFEHFHVRKASPDGYHYWCKDCRKIKIKGYYPKEKYRIEGYQKEYREKNREMLSIKKKKYYIDNRVEKLAKRKEHYHNNKEKCLLSDKISKRKHKDSVRETKRKYRHANMEKIQLYHTMRRTSGSYVYAEIQSLKVYQQNKCFYCECDISVKYTIEHVIPISKKGTNNIENIVLACKSCNCSKQERNVRTWIISKFEIQKAQYLLKKLHDYEEFRKRVCETLDK